MASPTQPEATADAVTRPPELSEAEYVRAVLKQQPSKTEDELDHALLAAAQKLGIDTSTPPAAARPSTPPSDDKPTSPDTASSATTTPEHHRQHARGGGGGSTASSTTAHHHPTSSPCPFADTTPERTGTLARKRSKSLSFSQYEKYLSQLDPTLSQPRFLPHPSSPSARAAAEKTAAGVLAASTRRGVTTLKRGLASRLTWHRRKTIGHGSTGTPPMSCICCREDFASEHRTTAAAAAAAAALHTLPCGHTYCQPCLSVMVSQATTDESKMPPRCCTQPVPGAVVKAVLRRRDDLQQAFLKAVQQYSTPWGSRVFCANAACGEFIPPRARVDPRQPFEVACRACGGRVCVMCRRGGHGVGVDCPGDWELEAVLRMGERSGWRRCYKCRTLVELTAGCTHMTCRCKAQFCYICGAVWDPVVGCPNYCNGEEELERRRVEEEAREAEAEALKQAREEEEAAEEGERVAAARRTAESGEVVGLVARQRGQMGEFEGFERKMRWVMRTRHEQRRLAAAERRAEQVEKMRERHAKTEQHLEDRQIEAEMELRSALEQSERSVRIRLKYMEAYCNGPESRGLGGREVTRKHREQLVQQYHVRDGMERRHESQINVLREKQARRMEELTDRHEKEIAALEDRGVEELEDLGLEFANEEEALARVFGERRGRMLRRWALEAEILRREMEERDGVRYGPVPVPEWLGEDESRDGSLPSVREEELSSSILLTEGSI